MNIQKIYEQMETRPQHVRFTDLVRICDHYFGPSRQQGSSHRVYKTPWPGDPRVNIQDKKGMAKPYQVKQVLKAIKKIQSQEDKK
jgi:hypothetical protein